MKMGVPQGLPLVEVGMGIVHILGGVNQVGIAPIPAFPRGRVKEQFGGQLNKSHQLRSAILALRYSAALQKKWLKRLSGPRLQSLRE
jgi:hypothetical protein